MNFPVHFIKACFHHSNSTVEGIVSEGAHIQPVVKQGYPFCHHSQFHSPHAAKMIHQIKFSETDQASTALQQIYETVHKSFTNM